MYEFILFSARLGVKSSNHKKNGNPRHINNGDEDASLNVLEVSTWPQTMEHPEACRASHLILTIIPTVF